MEQSIDESVLIHAHGPWWQPGCPASSCGLAPGREGRWVRSDGGAWCRASAERLARGSPRKCTWLLAGALAHPAFSQWNCFL